METYTEEYLKFLKDLVERINNGELAEKDIEEWISSNGRTVERVLEDLVQIALQVLSENDLKKKTDE